MRPLHHVVPGGHRHHRGGPRDPGERGGLTLEATPLETLLGENDFFARLEPSHLRLIAGCGRNEHFEAGQFLFRCGEQADRFYLVRAGRVSLELDAPGRGSVVVDTAEPGEIAGVSWLFPPYRWQLDARAAESVRAVGFDATCLRGKADEDPAVGYALMKRFAELLAKRMHSARLRLLDLYADARSG